MQRTRHNTFPHSSIRSFVVFTCFLACVVFLAAAAVGIDDQATDDKDTPRKEEPKKLVYVKMTTTKGDFVLELNREKAPITVDNFVKYVEDEYYDGTIFHRVIASFMIQGGGFDEDMRQKQTREPIKNEWENGLKNERGTIAMARLGNQPDSATSQFFINVTDNPFLDEPRDGAAYAVFGKVVAGMSAVDEIRQVRTRTVGAHQNVPIEPVVIREARVISEEDAKKAIEAEKQKQQDDQNDG